MRKSCVRLLLTAVALTIPVAALAQRPAPVPQGSTSGSASIPAAPTQSGFRDQHTVTGEVTGIDSSRGMVRLRTDTGEIEVPFSPGALEGIRRGDRIDVQLGMRPSAASPTPGVTGPMGGAGLREAPASVPPPVAPPGGTGQVTRPGVPGVSGTVDGAGLREAPPVPGVPGGASGGATRPGASAGGTGPSASGRAADSGQ